jgi:hypothetical protein
MEDPPLPSVIENVDVTSPAGATIDSRVMFVYRKFNL